MREVSQSVMKSLTFFGLLLSLGLVGCNSESPVSEAVSDSNAASAKISSSSSNKMDKSKLAKIHGKIQIVTSFPDYKVQVVDSFADLHVKKVTSFPDDPGEWQLVDSFPRFQDSDCDEFS